MAQLTKIDAELQLPLGRIQVVQNFWSEPIDVFGTAHTHHLELSLLPRSDTAKGCFPHHWGPHRFEPIGEVFLLPAQQMVHAKSDCRHQSSVVCQFDPATFRDWFDEQPQWSDGRLHGSLDLCNASIRQLLYKIGVEIRNPTFACEALVELMAAQIVIELARHLRGIEVPRRLATLSHRRLQLIDERLRDGPPPTLADLAALCGLSVRQLTRAFRASRGHSIGNHIAALRVERARRLLASGMQVKAVAHATGFAAATNFAAAFLRATGETPRQYRERYRLTH